MTVANMKRLKAPHQTLEVVSVISVQEIISILILIQFFYCKFISNSNFTSRHITGKLTFLRICMCDCSVADQLSLHCFNAVANARC